MVNEHVKWYFSHKQRPFDWKGLLKGSCHFVTLKRLKGNENEIILEKFLTLRFEPYEFIADTVTLFKSELRRSGSIYKAIEKFKLGERNGER